MKRLELKKLITCALIISTVTSIGVIPAKATTTSDLYKQAYDATMNVIETGKEYNISPRHADNNTDLKSNKLDNIYKAVEEGNMQKAINNARECISKLPSDQWQAKNTFSNLLDGYQQPSYEHIVDVALQLNKLTKQDENKFINPTSWDESKKKEFCNTVKERQHYIEIARALNKGVDPTYGKTYSSALDKPQQTVINMVNDVVEDAKKSSNPSDIEFAESVVKAFKESVSENSNIKNYVTGLQKDMDSLVELSKNNKADLEAQAKQIEALKEEVAKLKNESHKEDFEKEINSLKTEIANLKNTSHTIVSIPSNQEAIDIQAKLIKELQEQIKNGKPSDYEQVKKIILEDRKNYNTKDIAKKIDDSREVLDKAISLDNASLTLPDKGYNNNDILNEAMRILISIQTYSICDSATDLIENEKNKLFPNIISYIKTNGIRNLNKDYDVFCIAIKLYKHNDDKMKELLKQEKDKQLDELNKIDKKLNDPNSISIKNYDGMDFPLTKIKESLNGFIRNIKPNSSLYPKLEELCKKYVDSVRKFTKNIKGENDINHFYLVESVINLDDKGLNISIQKDLQNIGVDFVNYFLKPTLMERYTLNSLYNINSSIVLPRVESWITTENLKNEKLSNSISILLDNLCKDESSPTYKQYKQIKDKFDNIYNKIVSDKQIEELNNISKELNNISEDDQACSLKTRLSGFCGNKKITEDSLEYPRLVEVCNKYVDTTKKFINKAENTRNKKDIAIAKSMIFPISTNYKILPFCEKELFKVSYDFINFCLNPKYATEYTLEVASYAYNMASFDNEHFDKYLINKLSQLVSKDILKDISLAQSINNLLTSLEYRSGKTTEEHKVVIKLKDKLKELNQDQQAQHEVINPSQEDKEKEQELEVAKQKEIQNQITELDDISGKIKNVKSRIDFELVENKLEEFSRKKLDTNINNKYNSVIIEYMNLLKQNISDLESLDDVYDKNYILYKIKNFENNIAKNNIQKLEIEDCLNKKISNVVESVNFINNKNNLDESISMLNRYKGIMLYQGNPYNKNTYNSIFNIYSELAQKIMNEVQKNKNESLINNMKSIIEAFKYEEKSTSKFYIEGQNLEKQLNSIKQEIEKDTQKQDTKTSIENK